MNPQPVLAEIAIKALTVLGGGGVWAQRGVCSEREKANADYQTQKEGSQWLHFGAHFQNIGVSSVQGRLNLIVGRVCLSL